MAHAHGRARRVLALMILAASMLCANGGCQSNSSGPLARWRMATDEGLARPLAGDELGTRRGLLSRWLHPASPTSPGPDPATGLVMGSDGWRPLQAPPSDPEAEAQFAAAEALYQEGNLPAAEKAFERIAKRKKGSRFGEKAAFFLAEARFQQGELVKAHDSYEQLMADYPGTTYLDQVVAREYAIAQDWLAALENDPEKAADLSVTNWWQGRHPAFDVGGNSLAVLEHVRHHDPLGPLADEAVYRIARYHEQRGDHEQATYYFDQLITDYPRSELMQDAQLRSIEAKLNDYLGPEYDGQGLEEARKLVMQTMTMFPERQASTSDAMYEKLALIDEQMAERAYKVGEHYLWTGKINSAEYSFGEISARWPKSPWAAKAKEQLAKIATMPRKETKASTILLQPGGNDPFAGGNTPGSMGSGGMGGMGGMGGGGMGGMGGVGGGP